MAGLRVLPLSAGATSRIRRGTVVSRGPAGMISVAGGKLTMWRAIGRDAASLALGRLGAGRRVDLPVRPLPGAAPPVLVERSLARRHPALPGDVVANLARNYGTSALELLDRSGGQDLGRIHARTARISGRRCPTRSAMNGRPPSTTCCCGARRSVHAAMLIRRSVNVWPRRSARPGRRRDHRDNPDLCAPGRKRTAS